jgi:hypothetical protein
MCWPTVLQANPPHCGPIRLCPIDIFLTSVVLNVSGPTQLARSHPSARNLTITQHNHENPPNTHRLMLLQHRDPHPPTETLKLESILFKLWQPPEPHRLESVVVVLGCVPWQILRDPGIGMERLGGLGWMV